jgi:hypothetical protein
MGRMEGEAEDSSLAESGSHPIHNGRARQMSRSGLPRWMGEEMKTVLGTDSEASEFKSGRAGLGSLRGGFLVDVRGRMSQIRCPNPQPSSALSACEQ